MFDQGGTGADPRPLRGPSRDGVHRQKIVAVDTDAGNAVARPARRKGTLLPAGISLERRNGPLVVDDIEDHRCLINRCEQQCMVKVRLRAAALADPTRGDVILALDRRRHRPADRLRKLGREIARDRKNVPLPRVIHHRQLTPLAHVPGVRQQLVHHVDQRHAARDVQPLIAIRREQHVAGTQRHARRHGDGLLTERTDVERDLSRALRALHAFVEDARQQHVAQTHLQLRRVEMRMPRSDRVPGIVENAHQFGR